MRSAIDGYVADGRHKTKFVSRSIEEVKGDS